MASWNNCPYEIRCLILSAFSQSLIDDAHRAQSMCELLRTPPPYPAVRNPWKAFKSAILVSHEFSNILNDIKIHERTLPEALRTEQGRCLRTVLSNLVHYQMWQLNHPFDTGTRTALEVAEDFAGNFWKNFDMFDGSWNCLSAMRQSIGWQADVAMIRHLMPFLQHLDDTVPPSAVPISPWSLHPQMGYDGDVLYDEGPTSCRIDRIVELSSVLKHELQRETVFGDGEWGPMTGAGWKAVAASSPRQWLVIDFFDVFEVPRPLYLVNVREKNFFQVIGFIDVFDEWMQFSSEID
jgi:hypothetical protein